MTDAKECKSTINWELHNQFGHQDGPGSPKLRKAGAVALNKAGNVAVFDYATVSTHLYDNEGRFKCSFDTCCQEEQICRDHLPLMSHALVAGPDGNYFLRKEFYHVEMYGANGVLKKNIKVLSPRSSPAKLGGLAFDNNGHLLVGVYDHHHQENIPSARSNIGAYEPETDFYYRRRDNSILVLKELNDVEADSDTSKIRVSIQPDFLAVTPLNSIVIVSLPRFVDSVRQDPWLQIINEKGEVKQNLVDPPPGVTRWRQCGVCCNSDTIFVTNDNRLAPDEYGVYCFSLLGDYLGCATKEVINPVGIAVSEDGNKMYVAQWEGSNPEKGSSKHGVKVFRKI